MKVLVLGHNGMLGHMVKKYLLSKNIDVHTTNEKWPSNQFKCFVKNFEGDYIINCIGAIHQRTKIFDINWELPIFLDFYAKSKIIHPGTDCEIDLDEYGVSKKIARDFVVYSSSKTKSIKTSIIGPELNSKVSLMEWFLSNVDGKTVYGYELCLWNGNTTLTWAEESLNLMLNWENYQKETILYSDCVSKKELLQIINEVFNKDIEIKSNFSFKTDKCLEGNVKKPNIRQQLIYLKKFYYD